MKNFAIIIIMVLCTGLVTRAQQTTQNEIASVGIPNGLAKPSKISGTNPSSTDESSRIQQKLRLSSLPGEKYAGKGIIKFLQHNAWKLETKPDYLKDRKRALDGMYTVNGAKAPAGYSSTIKKFSNCEALITKSQDQEYVRYSIFSTNTVGSRVFNATIVALKKDEAAADQVVDRFIASIKFN